MVSSWVLNNSEAALEWCSAVAEKSSVTFAKWDSANLVGMNDWTRELVFDEMGGGVTNGPLRLFKIDTPGEGAVVINLLGVWETILARWVDSLAA